MPNNGNEEFDEEWQAHVRAFVGSSLQPRRDDPRLAEPLPALPDDVFESLRNATYTPSIEQDYDVNGTVTFVAFKGNDGDLVLARNPNRAWAVGRLKGGRATLPTIGATIEILVGADAEEAVGRWLRPAAGGTPYLGTKVVADGVSIVVSPNVAQEMIVRVEWDNPDEDAVVSIGDVLFPAAFSATSKTPIDSEATGMKLHPADVDPSALRDAAAAAGDLPTIKRWERLAQLPKLSQAHRAAINDGVEIARR